MRIRSGRTILKCSRVTINNLINKIKETESASRRKGTGTTVSAINEENAEIVDELILSQEEQPGTHLSIREIAPILGISKSSVHRMVKKKKLRARFKSQWVILFEPSSR